MTVTEDAAGSPATRRLVFVGAGAIGGVVAGYLARAGLPVALVARGEHGARIAAGGLLVRTPGGEFRVHPPVAATPAALGLSAGDVVVLAVKSQDTAGALDALVEAGAGPGTPIVCMQNSVVNEPAAAERFRDVYGVTVMCPSGHLEPGVVEAYAGPVPAILDVGRHPDGVDDLARWFAAVIEAGGMVSEARPDIMRWKHAKLLLNLGNAVEAVCGPGERGGDLSRRVHEEGEAVLRAAGIPYVTREEDAARRGDILQVGDRRNGSSTWQSLTRGRPAESDALNGFIVRLGAAHGVPTPLNAELLRRVHGLVAAGSGPTAVPASQVLAALG